MKTPCVVLFCAVALLRSLSPTPCLAAALPQFESPVTEADGNQLTPVLSGRWIAWNAFDEGGSYDIRAMDLSTGQEFLVAGGPGYQWQQAIDGDWIVWATYQGPVCALNLADSVSPSGPTAPIVIDDAGADPSISGDIIAWAHLRGGDFWDIYAYSLSTGETLPVCVGQPYDRGYPKVGGDTIAWLDHRRDYGDYPQEGDIYAYDVARAEEIPVCILGDSGRPSREIAVEVDLVVWADFRSDGSIYAYDLSAGMEIPILPDAGPVVGLDISDGLIVWRAGVLTGEETLVALDYTELISPTGATMARSAPVPITIALGAVRPGNPSVDSGRVAWDDARNESTSGRDIYILVHFSDVKVRDWAFWATEQCARAGIVAGYPDGSYQPTGQVFRDQMAVYISRALAGGDSSVPAFTATPTFPDVPTGNWALKYVEYAVDQAVVTGYDDGNYHPEYEVNRAQMAVYVARAMVAPTGEVALVDYIPSDPRNFPDVASDFWAYKHVEYCVEHGVVNGYDDGLYHPEIIVTRDQMAVYIARAFNL
jgi:hypothetical protein